jgi:hypothetical protein
VFAKASPVVRKIAGTSARIFFRAPRATDTVDGTVPVKCAPASGSVFKAGTREVTCTARDRSGNASSVRFALTVEGAKAVAPEAAKSALTAPPEGAALTAPPTLAWRAVANADYYNVQLYRAGQKILSIWPTTNHLRLSKSWTYAGKRELLVRGSYRWYVWPGFGPLAKAKYGAVLGSATFAIR